VVSIGYTVNGQHTRLLVTDQDDARAEAIEFASFAGTSSQAFDWAKAQVRRSTVNAMDPKVQNGFFAALAGSAVAPSDDRPVVCIDFDAQKFYDSDREFDLEWLGRGGKVDLPRFAQGLMQAHSHGVDNDNGAKDYDPDDWTIFSEEDDHKFNVVSSQIGSQPPEGQYQVAAAGALHLPLLDLDFEAALIPSSAPGHYHLYLDKPMPEEKYRSFIKALFDHGIIAEGNYNQMERKGRMFLRLPWVKKGFLGRSGLKK